MDINAVFVDRDYDLQRLIRTAASIDTNTWFGVHKRYIFVHEDGTASCYKLRDGEIVETMIPYSEVYDAGRKGFTILQKEEHEGGDYILYMMLTNHVATPIVEEDIWI